MSDNINKHRLPTKFEAVLPILVLLGIMIPNYAMDWGLDPHMPLVLATAVAMVIGKMCGMNYTEIMSGGLKTIEQSMEALLILMLVGCLTGAWIMTGTIPAIVYYGLNLLTPQLFLPVGLVMCSVIGLASGSAWTTTATVGIAFMSIGAGLGINPAITAGMCISGAAMGDKLSPLSDSTNLSAGVAETNLFDHVRAMLTTTVPSFVIALIIYATIGFLSPSLDFDNTIAEELQVALFNEFNMTPLLLLPALAIVIVAVLRIPAIPGIFAATVVAFIFAGIFQGAGFIDMLSVAHYGCSADTGNELADVLLNRGGMNGMMWTINVAIIAIGFGGILHKIGVVETLLGTLTSKIKGVGSLILITMATSLFANISMCDQYLALIIPAALYKDLFDKHGLSRSMLSRTLEDMGTLWSPLIPWTSCGAHHTLMLGVSPIQYAPFAFVPLLTPIIALIGAHTGRLIIWADGKQSGLFSKRLKQKPVANAPEYSLKISLKALEGRKEE
ncbi:MAG: Na+/H+ antiporter NhaC [Tissierellia bacterium]|nr:Na+/H+ antiporter NhaC [Bacillota bacterium]NLL23429.1 Na+/H+ antiporter NhaC [Tissierellia bacterium]